MDRQRRRARRRERDRKQRESAPALWQALGATKARSQKVRGSFGAASPVRHIVKDGKPVDS